MTLRTVLLSIASFALAGLLFAGSMQTQRIYFKTLRSYDIKKKVPSEELKSLDGKQVSIVGYMIPFDSIENIDRFILLQAPFMGCMHVPPPQPHESLLIDSSKLKTDYVYDPIIVEGKFQIKETYVEGYLASVFVVDASKIKTAESKDLELDGLPDNYHSYGDY